MNKEKKSAEEKRLEENRLRTVFWKKWGPYLSERQWGTVREDYSADGGAWDYFPHDHARSRSYRWGEDGLAGISDIHQDLCFAVALWNGKDPILKERLFGLNGSEGNHGEDVKELYYYLDNTPTHSYMKFLYKYPQKEYPYRQLIETNRNRSKLEPEFELIDTGIFEKNNYFDVFVEYAKHNEEDILIRINICNRGPEKAKIMLLPTLWFRNRWQFDKSNKKPVIKLRKSSSFGEFLEASHDVLGTYYLYLQESGEILFTENETNAERLYNIPNSQPWVKDAFHDIVVGGKKSLKGKREGTKAAPLYIMEIPGGKSRTINLRLSNKLFKQNPLGKDFDKVFNRRIAEADEFYSGKLPAKITADEKAVQRQAFAGLLWSKQYYNYELETWLAGDKNQPRPPGNRYHGRNHNWKQLFNRDVISMPDKWEYPWYATWDLAFHCVSLAVIDPDFAKEQLILLLREWYMHSDGQIPAYEWALGDVNPPVHAWAALKVYQIEKKHTGTGDITFLKRVFHKLLLNFTWWVNRKDSDGHNIFQGGFLGLDNIGIFDRSKPLPTGGHLEQTDGTSWMAMYSLNLMEIALEIALIDPSYEDVASKFFEHFVHISEALNQLGEHGHLSLWNEEDEFFYDAVHLPDGGAIPLKVRSLVGLTPVFAVSVIEKSVIERLPGFKKRLTWFRENRKSSNKFLAIEELKEGKDILLSLIHKDRLVKILDKMLDEREFLSRGGIRSVSKYHKENPFILKIRGSEYKVDYEPAESTTYLFGGNSNWRGPIWFPMNYLIIDSLKKFYHYYKDTLKVACPTGSKKRINLSRVSEELCGRLTKIFLRDKTGKRFCHGDEIKYAEDPYFSGLILFYEYFHGDSCRGLGASHQTGWTGLAAELISSKDG